MAHATKLDQDSQMKIIEQLAESVSAALSSDAQGSDQVEIGETFEVWNVPTLDMSRAAVQTGALHQQLLVNGLPVGFVRSQRNDAGVWEETEIIRSPLAAQINAAIEDADAKVTEDTLARLLLAPEYHVTALWFEGPRNQCYVIACPDTFKNLSRGQVLDGAAFLQALQREKPITGVYREKPAAAR
jgi:hypothetical protein